MIAIHDAPNAALYGTAFLCCLAGLLGFVGGVYFMVWRRENESPPELDDHRRRQLEQLAYTADHDAEVVVLYRGPAFYDQELEA